MADIHNFSEKVTDLAQRLEDVADAANGKGIRRGSFGTRWLILPAVGAGLYALATNGSLARQTRDAMEQAKTRASELPDDLVARIRQTSQNTSNRNGSRRQTKSTRKSTTRKARRSA